jgi:hypothetical protein
MLEDPLIVADPTPNRGRKLRRSVLMCPNIAGGGNFLSKRFAPGLSARFVTRIPSLKTGLQG